MTADPRQAMETEALAFLFRELRQRDVAHAVLRNYETLPESVGARDIDLVVRPEDLPRALAILRDLAAALDCKIASVFHDDMFASVWLVRRLDGGAIFNLSVDFFPGRRVYGIEFISAAEMLADTGDHSGIPVVRDLFVFLDKWLYHQIVGRPTPQKYDATFARIAAAHRDRLVARLAPVLGRARAESRIDEVTAGKASAMTPPGPAERRAILWRMAKRNGPGAVSGVGRFALYRLRDHLRPGGVFLSISGPDGSGKTTVIDRVIAEIEQIHGPKSVSYRHFRPSLLPRIAEVAKAARAVDTIDTDYHQPHRARPSGTLGSLVRLGYYLLDYLGGYARTIYPALVRREVILFDRYVYDMIGDPGRSRIALPPWLTRTAARLIPLPRWAFFIRVTPEEVHRRKQELSLDAIRALNDRYGDLVARGMLIAVDNDGAPEAAAAAIVDRIVADRAARSRRTLERLAR